MLKAHMDAVEDQLVATSKIPASSGHSLHKGTPREAFIREYLETHLPSDLAIGTGEIIDKDSKPGELRNQYDIVVYRRSFPKLHFGGGVDGFLIESVVATIEVKSVLTKSEFESAAKAAFNAKSLTPSVVSSFSAGYVPPSVLNIIVAYDGPASMATVHGWIDSVYTKNKIPQSPLPVDDKKRVRQAADAVDAVFVLKRGFLHYDNQPMGFSTEDHRKSNPTSKWIWADTSSGNLLFLFLLVQTATAGVQGRWLNALPYLASFKVHGIKWGK